MDYYAKIAGPGNRAQSALMERGVWPGQQPNQEILEEVLSGKIPTYQTASRAAYFLILKKWKEENDSKHVDVQDTHLVYYPGSPEDVQDKYVLVLEKALPKTAQKLSSAEAKQLSHEVLKEWVEAIIRAGLWNIKDNVYLEDPNVAAENQKLLIVDLEQPNNSAPKDFFHKNETRSLGNFNPAIEQLLALLQGDSQRLQIVRDKVEELINSPGLKQLYKDYDRPKAPYRDELLKLLSEKAPKPEVPKPVQSSQSESKQ